MTPNQLPPLPEPHIGLPWRHNAKDGSIHSSAFTWAQMHAYALAALAQQAQEPVAWLYVDTVGERYLCFSRPTGGGAITNLYATPPAPQVPAPVDEREAWLPIESAPKDGTPILAAQAGLHPETGEPFVPCSVILDGDKVQVFCDSDADEWVSLSDWRLTHWQPLPPAPQTKGQP